MELRKKKHINIFSLQHETSVQKDLNLSELIILREFKSILKDMEFGLISKCCYVLYPFLWCDADCIVCFLWLFACRNPACWISFEKRDIYSQWDFYLIK